MESSFPGFSGLRFATPENDSVTGFGSGRVSIHPKSPRPSEASGRSPESPAASPMKSDFNFGSRSTMPSPKSRKRAHRRKIVGEEPVQDVGHHAHLPGVVAPPHLVATQHFERADVEPEPVRVDDRLGERRRVAEAHVEPLPRDRMDAVRGVAEKREARSHEIARQRQAERIGGARPGKLDRAEPMPEAPFELRRGRRSRRS